MVTHLHTSREFGAVHESLDTCDADGARGGGGGGGAGGDDSDGGGGSGGIGGGSGSGGGYLWVHEKLNGAERRELGHGA